MTADDLALTDGDALLLFKVCRADGTDFRTGKVAYRPGEWLEVDADGPEQGPCGRGLHLSPCPKAAARNYADRNLRPWKFFACHVDRADVIAADEAKFRVRRLFVVEELSLADVYGADIVQRVERMNAETATWKSIPWLQPPRAVSDEEVIALFHQWHAAMAPWAASRGVTLPMRVRLCRTSEEARAAADAAADADAVAAVAVGAADAAAAAIFCGWWGWRWYVRPRAVLRRHAYSILGATESAPWAPFVELLRLGCAPIGYVRGEFVIYVPPVAS